MPFYRYCIATIIFAGVLLPQTDTVSNRLRIDQEWAQKNEIPAGDVRAMRTEVGFLDTTANGGIFNVDAISLRHRNHVLLVEASNGRCMRVHVFERSGSGVKRIWSLTDPPETRWTVPGSNMRPGRGICRKAAQAPTAYATAAGRIIVERAVHTDHFQRSVPVETYSFAWDGRTYALVEEP